MTHGVASPYVEGGSFCIFRDVVKSERSPRSRGARLRAGPGSVSVHLRNIIRPDTEPLCFSLVRAPVHLIPTIFLSVTLH